jgi:gliding motility-associated-like protein
LQKRILKKRSFPENKTPKAAFFAKKLKMDFHSLRFALLLGILGALLAPRAMAQTSTFDSNNENWRADGDPTSQTPAWLPNGGNPGGHIRVTDSSIGGTWYFVAPEKYHGSKCDAYGKYLRYDLFTSDTTDEQLSGGRPDVLLFGGGLTLAFDNDENPNLTWTHYDILLREDAGWRLTDNNGAVPTQAQFRAVLASLSGLKIRGEYRSQADFGGLDNVVLESSFNFDLDGDDSSGATDGDFQADTLCVPASTLMDLDFVLVSEAFIDSIVVRVLFPNELDELRADVLVGNIDIQDAIPHRITLVNEGDATAADFANLLAALSYHDNSPMPARGERIVEFRVYTDCGEVAVVNAFLPIFPPGNAGMDGDTTLCANAAPINLSTLLGPSPDPGGFWQPATANGGSNFDPARDAAATYAYILPKKGECAGDTAFVRVGVEQAFRLRADTTLCFGDTLRLAIPPNLRDWEWSDGGQQDELIITLPATYVLTGETANCVFSDSVEIDFYNCKPCPVYAPNVFSPNGDNTNAAWRVFPSCVWVRFRVEVFDRWGSLIFATDDPELAWDGTVQGQSAAPGVYLWRLEWEGESFGTNRVYRAQGDVTLIR